MNKVRSNDGTPIAFKRSGDGPPLILVGGAFNDRHSRAAGAPLAKLLVPHFTAFTYDRRGRGDSGDTPPYAVEREVDDLQALIAEAGGSAFVYGHSSGAVLALEAAARGLAITKLALYEPPFLVDDSRPRPPADLAAQLTRLISSGRRGDAVELFLTKGVGMPIDVVAQMRTSPFWPELAGMAHTVVYDVTITGDLSLLSGRLASVTAPTLLIDGSDSPPWMRHGAQTVADALPDGQYRTLAGQTHDVSPEALAPVLKEFFGG